LFANFLLRMLQWSPKARASASDLLDDPWLRVGQLDDNTHMSRQYYKEWMKASDLEAESDSSSDTDSYSGSDGSEESDDKSSEKSS
jgi:serine/threonine protein kinase